MSNKIFWILCALLTAYRAEAQEQRPELRVVPDTIFVYDTLRVTDTIWLPDPALARMAPLSVLPVGSAAAGKTLGTLFFFPDRTATLAHKYIIDSNFYSHLNNSESMKKIGFWGIMFFTLQHMVSAQNHLYFSAGAGGYRMNASGFSASMISRPAATFSLGAGYRRDLIAKKLSVGAELNVHHLLRSDFDSVISGGQFAGFLNPLVSFDDKSRNHWMYSLPLTLQWKFRQVGVSMGGELYSKVSPQKGPVIEQNGSTNINTWNTTYFGFSLTGGVDIPLTSRATLGVHYFHGMSEERSVNLSGVQVATRMRRVELKAQYFLF